MAWPDAVPNAPLVFVQQGGLYRPASPARKIDKDAMRAVIEKFIRGLHFLEVKGILAQPGPHPPDLRPLLPLDLRFQYSLIPNQTIRAVDPVMTMNDFAPELLAEIAKSELFVMFGPGFHYRRIRTLDGASVWLFRLWGQLDFVAFAYPSVLAEQVERDAGLRT